MPDRRECARGFDPARDDGAGDGWTNLEDYLQAIVGPAR